MLHKKDNVAFYFLDFTAYFNFLLSTEICPVFAMEKMKTEPMDRKKVNFKLKSSGFKSKSFLNLKFQIDYKVTVVKTYSECFIDVLKLQISFSLGNFELKKNHFGSNKKN